MTAVVRALPSLTKVLFVECDFYSPERALLCDLSSECPSPAPLARSALALEAAPTSEIVITSHPGEASPTSHAATNRSSRDDHDAPVFYPLIHPPPTLQSFVVGKGESYLRFIDFTIFRGWLDPDVLPSSLRSTLVGSDVDHELLCRFIAGLGPSFVLEYLKISLGNNLEEGEAS